MAQYSIQVPCEPSQEKTKMVENENRSETEVASSARRYPPAMRIQRLAAMLAVHGVNDELKAAAPHILVLKGACEELLRLLAARPRWHTHYLRLNNHTQTMC